MGRHWRFHARGSRGCLTFHRFNPYQRYAVAFYFLDQEPAALIFEGLASGGHFLEARQHKAGQRLEAFILRKG